MTTSDFKLSGVETGQSKPFEIKNKYWKRNNPHANEKCVGYYKKGTGRKSLRTKQERDKLGMLESVRLAGV